MRYLKSNQFNKHTGLIFGFSLKDGMETASPFGCNTSYKVGDSQSDVDRFRDEFFSALKIHPTDLAELDQIHGCEIIEASTGGRQGSGDALITDCAGIALAIYVADCIPVFLYDPVKRCIAAIHAGWRGTAALIVEKTVRALEDRYGTQATDIIAWIGPGITISEYEVDYSVASNFTAQFYQKRGDKYLLDLKECNRSQLLNSGVLEQNIETDPHSTFADKQSYHSFRRDGAKAGRHLGVIGLK